MKDVAYKVTMGGIVSYVSKETYEEMLDVYMANNYEVEEVTELPPNEKLMQRRDNQGVYPFTTADTLRTLRGAGNHKVGDVATLNNGFRDIMLTAVEVTGIRVVWERAQ